MATVSPSSTTSAGYSDVGLSPNTPYTYTVAAYDTGGNVSVQSSQVSATTLAAPPAPPTAYPICGQTVEGVPGDYSTIQSAIGAASVGDTIQIAAGTYDENVNLKSGICLEGAGIDQVVISKSGAPGITGDNVSYVIIEGLTVKNSGCEAGSCGGGEDGGGIQLLGSSDITLRSCRLTGNAAANGGGVFASDSSVIVDHCLIDGNSADNVGGGIVAEDNSTVALTNVTVADNAWSNHLGNGGVGGIRSYGSRFEITNSIVWGNNDKNLSGDGSNVSGSDIEGWSGGTNNISSNPDFVSVTDYHLQAGSAATGMGLN